MAHEVPDVKPNVHIMLWLEQSFVGSTTAVTVDVQYDWGCMASLKIAVDETCSHVGKSSTFSSSQD